MPNVQIISLQDVPPIELPQESWSKMLISRERVIDNHSTLGCSCFTPGTVTAPLVHNVEESVFVVKGSGELRLNDGYIPFKANDALFIPPGVWHWIANTGNEDIIMVFGFAYYEYPPTQRR